MRTISEDIQKGSFRRVYLLYGNEPYLRTSYRKMLKNALTGDSAAAGMNLLEAEGKEKSLPELSAFTSTLPFLADRRVVFLNDTGLFKEASEGYTEWIESLPETAVVVFSEESVDKRNRLYKKVAEIGHAAEMMHPDEEKLGKWILSWLKKRGLGITRDAYGLLMLSVGDDMESVEQDLEKLSAYCLGKAGVERADVEAVMKTRLSNRIFDFIAEVAAKRRAKALDLYYDLIALREAPLRILYLISSQFRQLLFASALQKEGVPESEMAAMLSVRPFAVRRLLSQAASFRNGEIRRGLELSEKAEEDIKTGNLSENAALEMLIIGLTR